MDNDSKLITEAYSKVNEDLTMGKIMGRKPNPKYFGPWPIEDAIDEAFVKWAKQYGIEPGSAGAGSAKDAFRAGYERRQGVEMSLGWT